ncbi:MAG: endonuclease [Candidatus Marinimicrobia bacterium]|nr:endonuclease [Candidatus Neomarinimicrobiota bacterium]
MNNLTQLRFTAATIILLFILSGTLPADIPAGYYDDAEGKVGAELKAALHNIINGHTEKSYGDARYILDETDQDPDNSNNVRVVYSNHSVSGTWDYGVTWNREHIWAKSRGIGDVNNYTKGAGSDLHNLRACIPDINSARSNRWFAECNEPYQYNGVNTGSYTSSSQWIWKPRNEDKGDVARIIFYMAVRYEGDSDEPDLEVVDYFPYIYSKEPLHAKLSSLLQWHLDDPVDSWERNRNDIIHDYQNNRNPFIDRPEFAARIWSDTTELDTPVILFSEYIEGSSNNKALEIYNPMNIPINLNGYSIISSVNGNLWKSSRYNFPADTVLEPGDVWVVANSDADQAILDVADETLGTSADGYVVGFNGNDVKALVKIVGSDTTILDIIGLYPDPQLMYGWNVAGITDATLNHTLVRKPDIETGNPNWSLSAGTNADNSEWIVYDSDTFD